MPAQWQQGGGGDNGDSNGSGGDGDNSGSGNGEDNSGNSDCRVHKNYQPKAAAEEMATVQRQWRQKQQRQQKRWQWQQQKQRWCWQQGINDSNDGDASGNCLVAKDHTVALGWEICSEFRIIPQLFRFRTFWTPEFSLKFSDRKMCSGKFRTHSHWFGILSRHQFFQFYESENVPAIFVSGKWHKISGINAPTLFACTIAITLLTISTWYTQIYENLIDVSRYWHPCWSTNTGKNGCWWWRSHWFSFQLQLGVRDSSTICSWFHLGLSGHYPWYFCRWWW